MRWKHFIKLFSILFILLHSTDSKPANRLLRVTNSSHVASPKLEFAYDRDGEEIFLIEFGNGLTYHPERNCGLHCYDFDTAQLSFTKKDDQDWYMAEWTINDPKLTVTDCFDLKEYSWFGGPEQKNQQWPMDQLILNDFPMITQEEGNCAVIEPYWLSEKGVYVYVDESTPLFINQNRNENSKACFTAKIAEPYSARTTLHFKYDIVVQSNAKEAHKHAIKNFLHKPTGVPSAAMIAEPIWSTWARYKRDIDENVVLNFAQEIHDKGFSGQYEIDDDWEECYGALTFNPKKFPDPKKVVQDIRDKGFERVTLWVHPFINKNCTKYFEEAQQKGYLVKDQQGNVLSQWWNSGKKEAALIDFTNDEAKNWWIERLKKVKETAGLDSFKFDAGETSWAPQVPHLTGDVEKQPNLFTTKYVEACSEFGDLIEVRSGYRSQHLPIFVRIVDKDSKWTFDNGLPTLITTMLQMNMVGYPFVLPDMVGGNKYGDDKVTEELFIRWLQANTFMPSIQFSLTPWEFTNPKILEISKKMVDLHRKFAPKINELMKKCVEDGTPLNPPVWWIAPDDPNTYKINDQYMLGEEILVAPVIEQGATERKVYLPKGKWKGPDGMIETLDVGTTKTYPAPLDTLLYFTLVKD